MSFIRKVRRAKRESPIYRALLGVSKAKSELWQLQCLQDPYQLEDSDNVFSAEMDLRFSEYYLNAVAKNDEPTRKLLEEFGCEDLVSDEEMMRFLKDLELNRP